MTDELQYIVDENDNVIGKASIDEAHTKHFLHRGAHVFIFNSKGHLLLHKRSKKWTFPNMWDSSAGGHVAYGSSYEETAKRELKEELGIEADLTEVGKIVHSRKQDKCNGFVMLYAGKHDGPFDYNKNEIQEIKFFDIDYLIKLAKTKPENFTPAFILVFKLYLTKLTYFVDDKNKPIRHASVKEAHEKKLLHRASYIMLVNKEGRILLQKRANVRNYPHMWTLSASGHVDYGESYEEAAHRELGEELGVKSKLQKIGTFKKVDGICNVWAALFLGKHDGPFNFSKEEVEEVKFYTPDEIRQEMKKHPKDFIISVKHTLYLYEKWKKKA